MRGRRTVDLTSNSTSRPRWAARAGPGRTRSNSSPPAIRPASSRACYASPAGRKIDLTGTRVTARVGIGPAREGGFGLAVALDLDAPGIDRAEAAELMARAHEICPYSRATRGNIDVTLAVAGAPIERAAA